MLNKSDTHFNSCNKGSNFTWLETQLFWFIPEMKTCTGKAHHFLCKKKAWVSKRSSKWSLEMLQRSWWSGQRGIIMISTSYIILLWCSFEDLKGWSWLEKSIWACQGWRLGMACWGSELAQGLFTPLNAYTRVSRLAPRNESDRCQSRARGSCNSAGSLKLQETSPCDAFPWPVLLEFQNSDINMLLGRLDLLMYVAYGMPEWQTGASTAFHLCYDSAQNFGALWSTVIAGRSWSFRHDSLIIFFLVVLCSLM